MGLLEQAIVDKLVALTSKEKRDELEGRIVTLIGGYPNKIVNHLPRRRGRADGGIDGRVRVIRLLPCQHASATEEGASVPPIEVEAAINVRVEKTTFSRGDLGAFTNDMDRESLEVGIIVTAAGLAPDADSEMKRHNKRGTIALVHLRLHDIISRQIDIPSFRFVTGELSETIRSNLEQFIQENSPKDERPTLD